MKVDLSELEDTLKECVRYGYPYETTADIDSLRALIRVARAAKVFMITAPPEQYRSAANELLAAISDIEDSKQ